MAHQEYSMDSESKNATKIVEEHSDSNCIYRMKRLDENGHNVYVWFRFCFCARSKLRDRSEEFFIRWR